MKEQLLQYDRSVTNWVTTTFGTSSRPFFEFFTFLGDPITIALVTTFVIVMGIVQANMRLAMSGAVIPATVLVGSILKALFERARPMTDYAMNMQIQTFSFPSGHASGSMIAYGLLAYIAFMKLPSPWNVIVAVLFALVPLFVGISRIYLGAHFPTDVLAGWLLGAVALAVIIFLIKPLA